ncbi:MAG: MMPL family transporter [Termitinemataceae bacterium]|nr:MAG: MMPL family transporter [Termitinemataceae bacterium]
MNKILRHPVIILLITAAITIFFGLQLPHAQLDNNNLRFVPTHDEARLTSTWIDDTFGSSLFILIGLDRDYKTILDAPFLQKIKEFSAELEKIETVDEVNSIMTSDYITSDGDTIIVENLVADEFSGTDAEIADLKHKILSWNLYDDSLVSKDWTATQIYVPLNVPQEDASRPEVIATFLNIRDMAREAFKDYAVVYVTGMPVISGTINEAMSADLIYLIPLVLVLIILIIFLPLKNLFFVFLSLFPVLLATIWSIGAMPLVGIKLSIISTVLPVILIAVGNSYGLHVLVHYVDEQKKHSTNISRAEHTESVLQLMSIIRMPIFLAASTTFASFLSFCFTNVMPIREFGYFSALGVLISYILSIFVTPAILILRGPKAFNEKKHKQNLITNSTDKKGVSKSDKIAGALIRVTDKRWRVLFLSLIILAVSIYGTTKVVVDNIFMEYFKPTTDIVKSDKFIQKEFGGSKTISIVAEAASPQELLSPKSLAAMDNLNTYLYKNMPAVGKIMSFTDFIKRTNQVFNADESPDGIPFRDAYDNAATDEDVSFGFGFGDDSADSDAVGEDDFGFGFAQETSASAKPVLAAKPLPPIPPKTVSLPLNTDALTAFLNTAADNGNRDLSTTDLLTELKKLTNFEGSSYYEIPEIPERYAKRTDEDLQRIVSNYLVFLAGNSGKYSNDPLEPTAIRSSVQLRTMGQRDSNEVVEKIKAYVANNFPQNIKVTVGGVALVEGSTNMRVVESVWSSIIIAFIAIFLIVSITNKSALAGLVSVIPLAALILFNFAAMSFLHIKLNIGTALIASITMGIGIDYTIHFMEAYKREWAANPGGNINDMMFTAYRTSGIAIIVDSVSTGAGFAILLFSQFVMLADFGLLVALSLLMSAVVGLIIVPTLLKNIPANLIFRASLKGTAKY